MFGVLCLLPTWFWDKVFNRLHTKTRTTSKVLYLYFVVIYLTYAKCYNDECAFCTRSAMLLSHCFLIPETSVIHFKVKVSQTLNLIFEKSWKLINVEGRELHG